MAFPRPRDAPDVIIICPFLHEGEGEAVAQLFPPDLAEREGARLFLFHDRERLGPERAFEHCWGLWPGHDIALLHSDMAPIDPRDPFDWLRTLLAWRRAEPDAGIIACNLLYPPDGSGVRRVQCAGGTLEGGVIGHLHGAIEPELLATVREVPWATFGGVLIRRSVLDQVGGFDRRYEWAYVMDVDYCLEARRRGARILQVPAFLIHEESRTTRPMLTHDLALQQAFSANFVKFAEKWAQLP